MKKQLLLLVFIIFSLDAFGQSIFLEQTKKNIIYFGTKNKDGVLSFSATGFLININGAFHLVTSKHVVVESLNNKLSNKVNDDNLFVILNQFDGKQKETSLKFLRDTKKVNWVFHKDPNVDIAILPFYLDVNNDDVKVLDKSNFVPIDSLFETYDVIIASMQTRISDTNNKTPIFRTGMISAKNKDKSFYIDGSVFPGNSGSPVYLKPSVYRFDKKGVLNLDAMIVDPLGYGLVGIVGEYETYIDIAISSQTGRPRVAFEENTGLTKVWSIDLLLEIANSKACQDQIIDMKNRK